MTEGAILGINQVTSEPKLVLTGGAPIGPETCFIGEEDCWPRRRIVREPWEFEHFERHEDDEDFS